jgi:catechol 2,3-dioxygenase-like lactoylglutathione lyase family enzyme
MLHDSNVIVFSATTSGDRTRSFYEGVLGLQFASEDDFAIVYRLNQASLRIQKVTNLKPQPFTVLGWSVPSVEKAVKQLIAKGVAIELYPSLTQDPLGIWHSPSGAKIVWFKDPDGNIISFTEPPSD